MTFYKLETWYRIPQSQRVVILNESYLWGPYRFVIRTKQLNQVWNQVSPLLHTMCKSDWESFNVGSGYPEPDWDRSVFLAVSMKDELTAMQFELTFC